MTQKSIRELIDVSLPEEVQNVIKGIIESHPLIKGYHQLRTRRSGSKRLIEMHIMLKPQLHLEQIHGVCDEIEKQIKDLFSSCDVIIHQEPYNVPNQM